MNKYIAPLLLICCTSTNFCMESLKYAYPLCQAASQNDVTKARELIGLGAHPDRIPGGDDRTPLWYSAVNGHVEMIKYLHSIGVALNGYSGGATALYAAAMKNHVQAARALVDAGADVNAGFPNDKPILVAASSGSIDVIKYLISLPKVNINQRDNGSYTPLWYASFKGHLTVVQALVEAKADLTIKGFDGNTPLSIAKEKKHEAIAQYLEQKLLSE